MATHGRSNSDSPTKFLFFDIDNCLYPRSYKIQNIMSDLIDTYFETHLSLPREAAEELHQRYYKDYGLAIEGLVRHHEIDPIEYNEKVDNALPLDDIIKPDPKLRRLLEDIDRSKVRLWLFTNAFITHGQRVVKLLGVDDLFDGITYCNYAQGQVLCKPAPAMFEKAMREACVTSASDCLFVDDSALNIAGAKKFGWKTAHLVEPAVQAPPSPVGDFQIQSLEELRTVFPEVFARTD